jgi:hypothetical protein
MRKFIDDHKDAYDDCPSMAFLQEKLGYSKRKISKALGSYAYTDFTSDMSDDWEG